MDWMDGDWYDYYYGLYPELRKQLENKKILTQFIKDPNFDEYYRQLLKKGREKYGMRDGLKSLVLKLTLLHSVYVKKLLANKRFRKYLYCYHVSRPNIPIVRRLAEHHHSVVLEGTMKITDEPEFQNDDIDEEENNLPVVIKFFEHGETNVIEEIKVYEKIRRLGGKTPWFSKNYEVWGEPVLVMQKLDKITTEDDEFKIGIDIINQVRLIHKFGVHSDIKPSNIMKCSINGTYFLIDNGGVTTDKLAYGYRRHTWTKRWTSQKMHPKSQEGKTLNQITTAKHDLIELGLTMRGIQMMKENFPDEITEIDLAEDDDPREGFRGKLRKYIKRVEKINRKEAIPAEVYDELIDILSE